MDEKTLFLTNQEVYSRFPYLKDIQPMQKTLPDGNFQLTYSANAETENGIKLPITIKVKTSPAGKILSITTSK
jgi:hypothetical protein